MRSEITLFQDLTLKLLIECKNLFMVQILMIIVSQQPLHCTVVRKVEINDYSIFNFLGSGQSLGIIWSLIGQKCEKSAKKSSISSSSFACFGLFLLILPHFQKEVPQAVFFAVVRKTCCLSSFLMNVFVIHLKITKNIKRNHLQL